MRSNRKGGLIRAASNSRRLCDISRQSPNFLATFQKVTLLRCWFNTKIQDGPTSLNQSDNYVLIITIFSNDAFYGNRSKNSFDPNNFRQCLSNALRSTLPGYKVLTCF